MVLALESVDESEMMTRLWWREVQDDGSEAARRQGKRNEGEVKRHVCEGFR